MDCSCLLVVQILYLAVRTNAFWFVTTVLVFVIEYCIVVISKECVVTLIVRGCCDDGALSSFLEVRLHVSIRKTS